MMDKERLKEIKEDVKMTRKDLSVSPSNEMTLHMGVMLNSMDYLIERVQELEKEIEQEYSNHKDLEASLIKENKLYREAIWKARVMAKYGDEHRLERILGILTEALEEMK